MHSGGWCFVVTWFTSPLYVLQHVFAFVTAGFLTVWLTSHVGPLRTRGVGVCLHRTDCGTGICSVTTQGSASENWWIPPHNLTVVSRNLDSKPSKVSDCFLETARRCGCKIIIDIISGLVIYSSRDWFHALCWEEFFYCSFFSPINKNPLGRYSELRRIFGINL